MFILLTRKLQRMLRCLEHYDILIALPSLRLLSVVRCDHLVYGAVVQTLRSY